MHMKRLLTVTVAVVLNLLSGYAISDTDDSQKTQRVRSAPPTHLEVPAANLVTLDATLQIPNDPVNPPGWRGFQSSDPRGPFLGPFKEFTPPPGTVFIGLDLYFGYRGAFPQQHTQLFVHALDPLSPGTTRSFLYEAAGVPAVGDVLGGNINANLTRGIVLRHGQVIRANVSGVLNQTGVAIDRAQIRGYIIQE